MPTRRMTVASAWLLAVGGALLLIFGVASINPLLAFAGVAVLIAGLVFGASALMERHHERLPRQPRH